MTIKHLYPDTRPTLDLKFAKDKKLDPRITFSRASSGTHVDANGVIQSAASGVARFDHNPTTRESLGLLVEEARTNSLTYSERLSDASWTALNATLTPNALAAPNGLFVAAQLTSNGTVGAQRIGKSPTATGSLSFSIYAKAGSAQYLQILQATDVNVFANFDLSLGVVGTKGSSAAVSIASAGNGWYKCAVSATVASTGFWYVYIVPSSSASYGQTYIASINSLYLYGPQLEAGSFPTSYIPTPATFTSRASTATYYDANGVIQTAASGVARSNAFFPDSSGVMRPAGLLLEGAGTNLLTYSQNLTTWSPINMSVSSNVSAAPDGTTTAGKIIPNTSDTIHVLYPANTVSSITGTYTVSVFAKADGYNFVWLSLDGASGDGLLSGGAGFSLVDGTYQLGNGTVSASSQKLGNGWYRLSLTGTTTSTVTASPYVAPATGKAFSNVYFAGNGTSGVLIWGMQFEAGSYPTSYIPTTASTVTRAADASTSSTVTRSADVATITGSNFSSWYNQSEGTWISTVSSDGFAFTVSSNADNRYYLNRNSGNGYLMKSSGVDQAIFGLGQFSKAAIVYDTNYATVSSDGVVQTADTSVAPPVVDSLKIGMGVNNDFQGSKKISRITYYPTRLSNAILQTITS